MNNHELAARVGMTAQQMTAAEQHDRELGKLQDEVAHLFAEVHALTYRALVKLALFDKLNYWAGYQSCLHWMNFRLGISFTTAREHLRVARALGGLPAISAAFSTGVLSYSKVRSVTRIANAKNDDELAHLASAGTAGQVDKVVRACRKHSVAVAKSHVEERGMVFGVDNDGMFFVKARLMVDEGVRFASLIEQFASRDRERGVGARRADALTAICEIVEASDTASHVAEYTHQKSRTELVVHVDREVLSDPSADGRAQIEGTRAELISVAAETVRRVSCDSSVVEMEHDAKGHVLDVGRRSRKMSTPLRRAILERDRGCRFPGCPNQFVDVHHVKHWANGGETNHANLLSLCKFHHMQLHEGGFSLVFEAAEARSHGNAKFFDAAGVELREPEPQAPVVLSSPSTVHPFCGARWDWRMFDYRRSTDSLLRHLKAHP